MAAAVQETCQWAQSPRPSAVSRAEALEVAERRQVLGGAPTPLLAHSNHMRHRAPAKHAIWYH